MVSKPRQSIHSTFLFLALFISALLLIAISINTRYLEAIEDVVRTIAEPFVYVAHVPREATDTLQSFFQSKRELQVQNNELREELARLSGVIDEREFMRRQVSKLKEALSYEDSSNSDQRLAEVIRVNLNQERLEVTINKGRRDGITVNSVVLDPYGVFGRTIEVFEDTASVMLISDDRHALPVLVTRTDQYFIASGNGPNRELTLDHVNLSADIKTGDKLVTSGLGGVFPEGYHVGTVSSVIEIIAEAAKQVSVSIDSQSDKKSYLRVLVAPESP